MTGHAAKVSPPLRVYFYISNKCYWTMCHNRYYTTRNCYEMEGYCFIQKILVHSYAKPKHTGNIILLKFLYFKRNRTSWNKTANWLHTYILRAKKPNFVSMACQVKNTNSKATISTFRHTWKSWLVKKRVLLGNLHVSSYVDTTRHVA